MSRLLLILILMFGLFQPVAGCSNQDSGRQQYVRTGLLNDYAGLLAENEAAFLSAMLESYQRHSGDRLHILIVPGLSGESIAEFSARTARAWGVGDQGIGAAMLLTIALEEGSARVETGRQLEWLINEGEAETILRREMFPMFKEKRFAEGIRRGVEAIIAAIDRRRQPADIGPPPEDRNSSRERGGASG